MPFTVSHVAAILPAHRALLRWGFFSAAIVGSMVPDFGFLLPWPLPRSATHSLTALITFCLPMGLGAWWLFQLLIKPAWCAVLPGNWRLRLREGHPAARLTDWRAWAGGAMAIVLGACTHLVWDSFTHEDGRGVRMLPFLDDFYGPDLIGHPLRLYRWLQHASSLLGLFVVMVAAWQWSRGIDHSSDAANAATVQAEPMLIHERHVWFTTYLLVPVALLTLALLFAWLHPRPWEGIGDKVARLAVTGLRGACLSLLLVSACIRLRVGRIRLDA